MRLCDRPHRVGGAADRIVVDIFEAKLQAGDVAGAERGFELRRERRRIESRRRDQIETGAHASPR